MDKILQQGVRLKKTKNKRKNYLCIDWKIYTFAIWLVIKICQNRDYQWTRSRIRFCVRVGKPMLGKLLRLGADNLNLVYGQAISDNQRQTLASLSLEHFSMSCMESIIKPVDDRIDFEGDGLKELLQRAAERPAIVASLHLGCWDLGLRHLSQKLNNLAVVYRPTPYPPMNRLLNQVRSANSSCQWIDKSDPRAMLKWLRSGGTLVVMSDLHGRSNSVDVNLLGLSTKLSAGPFRLAQKIGCPIFPAVHVRDDDGRFRVHFGRPIPTIDGPDGPMLQAQALCNWQEPWIHEYCEQYLWIYRHWRDGEGHRLREGRPPSARALRQMQR